MNIEELASLHKAMSVPARLKILTLISDQPMCVNAITRSMDISQPSVSQHLAVLKHAGLVASEKRGYMVHYSIDRTRLEGFRRAVNSFPS
jgi:ArsR family transcriptional regulator, arsenate/arsenite/antimonite-responsive transcriptional repressor